MKDIIVDTLLDLVKIIPFLFLAFLIIELLEHKLEKKSKKIIKSSGKYGPIFGSILGLIPQCGFSSLATNLYITRIISLGTLVSIYLSTSDEMLPILISEGGHTKDILIILSIKLIVGLIFGFLIDIIFKKDKITKEDYHLCEDENCECEDGNIFKASLIHTIKVGTYILIISFVLNILFAYFGDELLGKILLKNTVFSPFISSLIGLIPNCGSSVIITEFYLNNVISLSTCIAGLLSNSGIALMILFKFNKNIKENFKIVALVYFIGVIVGVLLEVFGL